MAALDSEKGRSKAHMHKEDPKPTEEEKVDFFNLPCPIPYEEIHHEASVYSFGRPSPSPFEFFRPPNPAGLRPPQPASVKPKYDQRHPSNLNTIKRQRDSEIRSYRSALFRLKILWLGMYIILYGYKLDSLDYILLKDNEEGKASVAVLFATFGQDPVRLLKLILSEFLLKPLKTLETGSTKQHKKAWRAKTFRVASFPIEFKILTIHARSCIDCFISFQPSNSICKVFDEDNLSVRESSNDRLMRKKEAIRSREKISVHTLRGREVPPQLLHSYWRVL
nr:hypothetical protein CFP56_74442 [Quercus suber]